MADENALDNTTIPPAGQPNGSNARKRRRTAGPEPNSGITLRVQPTRNATRLRALRQTVPGNTRTTRHSASQSTTPSRPGPSPQSNSNAGHSATPTQIRPDQPVPTATPTQIRPDQPAPTATPTQIRHDPAPRSAPTTFTFPSSPLQVAPVAKSSRKKKVVKKAAEIYRFLPREMPSDMGGLQVCVDPPDLPDQLH